MHWIWDYFDSLIQFDRRLQFLLDMLTLFPRCALLEIMEKNLAFLMHIWSRDTKGFRGFAFGERGLWVQKKIRDLLICWFTVLPPLPPSVIIQPFDDSLDWRQFMSFCDCGRIGSSAYRKESKSRYHQQLSDFYSSNQTHLQCKVSAPMIPKRRELQKTQPALRGQWLWHTVRMAMTVGT